MKVLLDHNLPKRLRTLLVGHDVKTARQMTWEGLANGKLLEAATGAGFGAFLSIDKNLRYEQNLKTLPLPVIIPDAPSNVYTVLVPFVPHVLMLLVKPLSNVIYHVASDGTITQF